jgi:hypothetical protein
MSTDIQAYEELHVVEFVWTYVSIFRYSFVQVSIDSLIHHIRSVLVKFKTAFVAELY